MKKLISIVQILVGLSLFLYPMNFNPLFIFGLPSLSDALYYLFIGFVLTLSGLLLMAKGIIQYKQLQKNKNASPLTN